LPPSHGQKSTRNCSAFNDYEMDQYSDTLVSRTTSGGATVWPVKAAQIKANAQIQHTAEDTLIHNGDEGLLPAAVEYIEELGRVALVTQTRRMIIDNSFPDVITPPRAPLLSVVSITYLDSDYATQTVTSTWYRSDLNSWPGRIVIKGSYAWPTPVSEIAAITVNYTAGFGATAASVPPRWKQPIIALGTYWYENRMEYESRFVGQAFYDKLTDMVNNAGRMLRYA
jgi:uncharacterized phiE125 gp8 family phage protein